LAGLARRGEQVFLRRSVEFDQFAGGGKGWRRFGRPRAFDGRQQGAAADDEIAGIDERGDVKLASVEPVEGEFDQVQGGAGGGLVSRFEGLLVLLATEPEPDAVDVAFFSEIGRDGVAFP